MSRVIFLDIDGVLFSETWSRTETYRNRPAFTEDWIRYQMAGLDPACVERLNRIVEATGARIVITSSWRSETHAGGTQVGLAATLACCGLRNHRDVVVGITPDLSSATAGGLYIAKTRWDEIQQWMRDTVGQVNEYIVIDDCAVGDCPADRFLRTDMSVGLTDADADRAIEMLMEQKW